MKAKDGEVQVSPSKWHQGCAWLRVRHPEYQTQNVLLTPAQAMRLAARLQRWAWNQTKERKK